MDNIFGKLFTSLEMELDPLVELFTENIDFFGGNYIIYNSIEESSCHILRNLFFSLFQIKINGLETFRNFVFPSCLSLLTISNEIANRMSHTRYMRSNVTYKKKINYPDDEILNKIRKAVTFSNNELDYILQQKGLMKDYLKPFILELGDPKFSLTEKHPLAMFPLIKIGSQIVVGLPSAISIAIRHFMFKKATQMGNISLNLLNNTHHTYLQLKTHKYLLMFGYKDIKFKFPEIKGNLYLKESLYRFDSNKIAYTQLILDNAQDYTLDDPYGFWNINDIMKDLFTRQETIIKLLINKKELKCDSVFVLMIFGCIGRAFILHSDEPQHNSRRLIITSENLEIITHLRNYDRLTLWKFAGALKNLQNTTKVVYFSLIDAYSIYRNNNDSFYLDDSQKPIFLQIDPGEGLDYRIKAKQIRDIHSIPLDSNTLLTVTRREEDSNIPIYTPEEVFNGFLIRVVAGFKQPIWIKPHLNLDKFPKECLNLYYEFIEMLSYWLWQISPTLKPILEMLDEKPIRINLKIENVEKWIIAERIAEYRENQRFNFKIQNNTIIFEIPFSIKAILQRSDNLGERIIINELLIGFGNVLVGKEHENALNDDIRELILEKHIPLGLKKKMFLLDVKDNFILYPEYLPPKRLLQEHDLEEQLDNLSNLIDEEWKLKKVFSKESQVKLLNHITEIFYKRLKSELSQFNFISLLTELLTNYEAILYHKEFTRLTIPTRIECYYNIEKMVEQIQKQRKRITSTSIAIRTLIEIISANPPKGNKIINTDELDKLLAISYHITNWGFISDYIKLDLRDFEISFLHSSRIGVIRKEQEYEDDFLKALTFQDIESIIASFDSYFDEFPEVKDDTQLLAEINAISKAEFQISFVQIKCFLDLLLSICFEQKNCIGTLPLSTLQDRLRKEFNWSDDQIRTIIEYFSLEKRKKWEKPPNGFGVDDIWPWNYNRRLSYIRKPLVSSLEPQEDPLIYWGARNSHESGLQLLKLIQSGRYKIRNDSSREMKEYIARIKDQSGKEFTKRAVSWLKKNSKWDIYSNVKINPKKPLKADKDLGDIDILAIDRSECLIYSLECKKLNYGRNPKEMANEIERLTGKTNFKNSWMFKHIQREKWLKNNKKLVRLNFDLKCPDFRIYSLILVTNEIITQYMIEPKIPIISFPRLKREGVEILKALFK